MSAQLREQSGLSVVADPGRISRLVRGLSIALPDGRAATLASLFPKPRQVHCRFVDYVIQKEKFRMAEGSLRGPLSDGAIAEVLEREFGICVLPRTVASIRHDLAIPDSRSRRQRMDYLAATEGFSALVPLTSHTLRGAVPAHPGVYEIRAASAAGIDEERDGWLCGCAPPGPRSVLYIGSAGDLRKRLGEHLRGNSGNVLLYRHIAEGAARVRFRPVGEGWRRVERELYRVFCETFGAPPPCNRMSP
jgi:RNA polymerase sigma-54 factor